MDLLNFDLLRRPSNWLTVGTMVLIGLFALHYGLALIHGTDPLLFRQKHTSRAQ